MFSDGRAVAGTCLARRVRGDCMAGGRKLGSTTARSQKRKPPFYLQRSRRWTPFSRSNTTTASTPQTRAYERGPRGLRGESIRKVRTPRCLIHERTRD
ncbi:hypothetical protein B0H17DRAFT_1097537 [Mycena rosella]|uniref:Uncharacterized protein n=1 Tax=Mycena rosella TaxID=1033263 RepID=A0AAD7CQ94_MYCRO|nr:hypothetical protein B0H17DRAFT_1097537 [Mycena rosella]